MILEKKYGKKSIDVLPGTENKQIIHQHFSFFSDISKDALPVKLLDDWTLDQRYFCGM